MKPLAVVGVALLVMIPLLAIDRPPDFCERNPDHKSCATPTPVVASPTVSPVPTPSLPPSLAPTPVPGANVSGITIPPPLAGMQRVIFTEFPNSQALGQPPHPDTAQYLRPRTCGFKDSSLRGTYCWAATTSEHDGVLDQWLHTETGSCPTVNQAPTWDFTHVHNGSGGCNYVNAPIWNLPDQTAFMVSLVARFDQIPGRKIAYLRWCGPRVGEPGYCEDDYPEGKLDGGDCKGNFFHHHDSRTTQNGYPLCRNLQQWHLFQMRVEPGVAVTAWIDGALLARATQYVTVDSSYWVGQAETYLAGQTIPEPDLQGHILWDAFAVDLLP